MRDKIRAKLEEWERKKLGLEEDEDIPKDKDRLFYGQKPSSVKLDDWNYIVFGMEELDKSGTNSMDLSGYYFVDIIREDYIDDDTIFELIFAMESINGMKLCKGPCPIDYITKGDTNIVCEMMRLRFTRPVKRMNINAEN